MAAQVLPVSSPPGGSFLDSPAFDSRRPVLPPNAFLRQEAADSGPPTMPELRIDSSDVDDSDSTPLCSPNTPLIHPETPDSGFSGLMSSTPALKTPESEHCDHVTDTPTHDAPPGGCRKRKTVNFDESQTSVVMISPDDLFKTYSQTLEPSLESRDNPFLPGGDLSREAEDLLSKATIIRDNFYLKEDEKQALLDSNSTQRLSKDGRHVQTAGDSPACTNSFLPGEAVEERISPQHVAGANSALPPAAHASAPRVNGKAGEPRDQADGSIPEGQSSPGGGGGAPGLNVQGSDKKRGNKCCTVM